MKALPEEPIDFDLLSGTARKRKRETEKCAADPSAAAASPSPDGSCFTNAAFSSTPKKMTAARRRQQRLQSSPLKIINENAGKTFFASAGLEEKSISGLLLAAQKQKPVGTKENTAEEDQVPPQTPLNPFEVVRKPPKKKKRDTDMEDGCFENPGLNLELPEKQFNPYEVVRTPIAPPTQCFVNEALNLRVQDGPATLNPFEVQRSAIASPAATVATPKQGISKPPMAGKTNAATPTQAQPTHLKIGLPFTPTVGCRIDFKNMPLADWTPSKLLAAKLVFSPVPGPKRSIDSATSGGEESTAMDIGKELDQYQLELENSINEAKMRRNEAGEFAAEGEMQQQRLDIAALGSTPAITRVAAVEQKITFIQKLSEIVEAEEEEETNEDGQVEAMAVVAQQSEEVVTITTQIEETAQLQVTCQAQVVAAPAEQEATAANVNDACDETDNEENNAEEEDEDDFDDFKAPVRFVRAYRRDAPPPQIATTTEHPKENAPSAGVPEELLKKPHMTVKTLIRKSIRKLMHPLHTKDEAPPAASTAAHNKPKEQQEDATEERPNHGATTHIFSSIRHSLRRKPAKQLLIEDDTLTEANATACAAIRPAEISIIDGSERTMKLKSLMSQTDYARIEELTNERKPSLRSSLRKTTRGVRQQFMKSVFHKKQEEYAFCK